MIVGDKIKEWLDADKSVRKVADDLQLTSELILLVRMMFADGILRQEELENFKRICKIAFDIPDEDVPQVIEYLQDFGYETSIDDAAAMFAGLEWERKKTLLVHLLSIAKSDKFVHVEEAELLRKTSSLLAISAEEISKLRKR